MKSIVIAGYGFVGKAVAKSLNHHVTIHIVDPQHSVHKVYDFPDADGVIICVGTPSNEYDDCDVRQIYAVMEQVPTDMPVLIKSTVRPDYLHKLQEAYPKHSICYSPEFLRAATAYEDFMHQEHMVIGGENVHKWFDMFEQALPNCHTLYHCTITEAATIKYGVNSFLATKVAFFNQIFDICRANGADFEKVRAAMALDKRIGDGHTLVPGPDGHRGFGGACFPKDTKSFVKYSTDLNTPVTVVKEVVEYNNKLTQKH